MKTRRMLIPFALGLGLAGVVLWLLCGGTAPATAAPVLSDVEGPECQPLQAPGDVITVCLSGGCDYTSVQAAVDAASDGDIIKVAAGTYTDIHARAGVTQVVYISKTVTIRGSYTTANWTTPDPGANPTTLDAQRQGRVLYITGDISPTVEGLRITGGDATGLGGNNIFFEPDAGGGIYVITATVTISGCRVYSNTSPGYGGGLFFADTDVVFSNNAVFNNTAGWGGGGLRLGRYYSRRRSNAILNGNAISDNAADGSGGGLSVRNSDAILSENTISNNTADGSGGGLYLDWDHNTTLDGNTISGNTAADDGGGLYLDYSDATLNGNTISGNTANGNGGGLCLGDESNVMLDNNVVTDNQAFQRGAGLYVWGSSLRLRHTTIARNSGGDGSAVYVTGWHSTVVLTNTILVSHSVGISVTSGNTATLEATLWGSGDWANGTDWGGAGQIITGTHNYWGDPAFVDPDSGDYHIGNTSAARDAGVDASVNRDIDGQVRPMDWGYDVGADEYPGDGLDVVKQPSAVAVNPGQVLTYTVIVTSAGTVNSTGVVLTDTLDGWQRATGTASSMGSCTIADAGWGSTVVCTPGTMVTGTTVVVTLIAQVSPTVSLGQAMVNTVVVTAAETTNSVQVATYAQDCHVRLNDDPTEYTSIQTAVDAASPGDLIKVAGVCLGASEREGLRQQIYVDKSMTIRGGYTTTNWDNSDPVVNPTTLDALGQGRVLYITGDISPTVEGLRITGGDAAGLYGNGGGVYIANATATISTNRLFNNTAERGGGLYLYKSAATLSGNTVTSNTGSGLRLYYSPATLNGNIISGNTADWGGGGLYLRYSDATLSGNTVTSNTAQYSGGGLYLSESNATLSGNTIAANTAEDGGGLLLSYSAATLSGNTVSGNTATGYYGGGGGLCLYGSDATLSGNTVSGNMTNDDGGGLYLSNSDATLSGNTITTNSATNSGGGLYLYDGDDATIINNTVTANTARCGGGLYLNDSDATLSGNIITANTANNSGGGLYLNWPSDATLINSVIADNRADSTGSGLYIRGSSLRLLHTTIARNIGGDGSGVYVTGDWWGYSTVSLTNTILVSHTVGITVTAGNVATLEATLWGTDTWANITDWDSAGTIITGTHNYWGNPAFVDPDAGDYHIGLDSAAIDKGVDAGVKTDVDNEPRPYQTPDLGADEYWPPGVLKRIYLPLVVRQYQ